MAVNLVLGELGADTPPLGGAVALVLGALEGADGVTTDCTFAMVLRPVLAFQFGYAVPGASNGAVRMGWGTPGKVPASITRSKWADFDATPVRQRAALPWEQFVGPPIHRADRLPWGAAGRRDTAARLAWGRADSRGTSARLAWGRADPRSRAVLAPWQAATRYGKGSVAPWGRAALVRAPNRPLPYDDSLFGFTPSMRGRANLHFCVVAADTTLDLVLGFENCQTQPRQPDGTVIPSKRAYVQTHSLTAFRLPDLTPVPLTDFSMSADAGSFGWTLNANGPAEVLSLLAPDGPVPALLRVALDGMTWEFVVEGLRRTRDFEGGTRATITGRSPSALLSDPYMPEVAYLNAVPVTAQQIIEEALFGSDLTLDWQATDWLVPEGAWSFTGTPMAVVNRVAEAIGALVQSPRVGDSIIVKPRYPVLPWDWAGAAPDVTISLDAVVSEGFERNDRPAYDGVYVSGQAQGVLAQVKRTGTGPSLLLPLVTDPLMTDLDAARQRGEALLGAVGPQARMTITLPVLAGVGEPGVIDVNKLVLLDGWKGIVRAVTVNASQPVVRQTLTIERHL